MWIIQAYEKGKDELAFERDVGEFDVANLRPFWNVPKVDPMFDSYPLTPDIARDLGLDAEMFDFDRFDYFFEQKGWPVQ
jgi:hypothetical protein